MVVDHIEHHSDAPRVGRIDERFQIVWRAVGALRRVQQYTVVSPTPLARKVGNRHQLDDGHAQLNEMVQPGLNAGKRAFRAERTDMQLVDNCFVPGSAGPVVVSPLEFGWINDLARSMDILGIQAGRRIGDFVFTVDPVAVQRTGTRLVTDHFVEARIVPDHRQDLRHAAAVIQGELDPAGTGRPQSESDLPIVRELGPEGHAVPSLCHRYEVSRNSARDRPCNG